MSTLLTHHEVYGTSSIAYRLSVVGTVPFPLVRWTNCMGGNEKEEEGSDIIRT